MSYDIVKSIAIKGDKVYFTSAANNVSPRTFERFESEYFSKLYQEGGLERLLPAVAANIWEGNFHMANGSKLASSLNEGYIKLSNTPQMRYFLDTERAAQYIADYALHLMGRGPEPDIKKLTALRGDREAVLDVCSKNPSAFGYASEDIQKDREAAREHIIANRDKILFNMPTHFRSDKELAILALEGNGTIYRHLNPDLQADKDIVRLAFDSSRDRQFFEHLPDLIPAQLRHDPAFMTEVVSLCPKLHIHRANELLKDENFTRAWLAGNGWYPSDLRYVPYFQLQNPEIQAYIFNKVKDNPALFNKTKDILAVCGVNFPKPSLDSIISSADSKRTSSEHPSEPVRTSEHDR